MQAAGEPAMSPVMSEPVPDFGPRDAERTAADAFGVTATATMMRSERDRNFLLAAASAPLVLKVSNSAEQAAVVDLENGALSHVARYAPSLPLPQLVPAADGGLVARVTARDGRAHLVRLLTVVPGSPADGTRLEPGFGFELGRAAATLARGLRGFSHPAALRYLEWDPRHVTRLRHALATLADPRQREPLLALADRLADLPDRTANLPSQVAHGDLTLSNVLTRDGRGVSGIVDFGDIHQTARVSDLAISLTSLLRVAPEPWPAASEFLRGYQGITPLEEDEVEVLGDLVLARLAATIAISILRGGSDPHHAATVAALDRGSWAVLGTLGDGDGLTRRFRRMTGLARVSSVLAPDPDLLKRRNQLLGGRRLSPLFYRQPLQMTRGQGPWMWASDGARYLDAYNNVPVVGHAHPAVAQAISHQSRTLNVSSRYLHPNIAELAGRLLDTVPDELDTCLFMNSGSEANDLAWRMAVLFTGRGGAIVSDSGYHGVSAATAPLSANTWLPGQHPAHVATFPAPRLVYDAAEGAAAPGRQEAAARIADARDWLAARGLGVALALADPMFTSGGILDAAPDFMAGLADAVHQAGGLVLADEVQAGFGRSGAGLWSFARHGITPDFVTLGKPMGNGHPVAALITRSDIAARFAEADEYFSTFAGNPVSCAAALAVLDIIEEDDLIAGSAAAGRLLRQRVLELAAGMPLPVVVRGSGLLAGLEFPGQDDDLAPRLVERLRQERILAGSTGPGGRVLKVRPPLVWGAEHVEIFAAGLRRSLSAMLADNGGGASA
jgi:4-aminobutyrate aminotransferase-like enzyme/Ser/Thr protein kinase RdoA (MazF antagonist)